LSTRKRELGLGDAKHRNTADLDADALARDLIRSELDPLQRRRHDRDGVPWPLEEPDALARATRIDPAAPRAHEIFARHRADEAPPLELRGIFDGLSAAPAVLVALDIGHFAEDLDVRLFRHRRSSVQHACPDNHASPRSPGCPGVEQLLRSGAFGVRFARCVSYSSVMARRYARFARGELSKRSKIRCVRSPAARSSSTSLNDVATLLDQPMRKDVARDRW
jgi:hypothetical protein